MRLHFFFFFVFLILFSSFILAEASTEPMIMRTIKEIESVEPSDVANLGIGVFIISAQHNLGAYHDGTWMGEENKKCDDLVSGPVWIEFSWERPETDLVLIDGAGNERKIFLPESATIGEMNYGEYYWIAEDGSSYYANSNHGHGWPDLTSDEAFVSEHLARASLSPEQKNPEEEEPLECGSIEGTIKLKGRLVDGLTKEPIVGAKLYSAYQFFPEEVISDDDGSFEFNVDPNYNGAWTFLDNCHGWSDAITIQRDYSLWEDGQVKEEYSLALKKERFDLPAEAMEISGKSEVDMGDVYAWPSADISIKSDLKASFSVMYKYKNREGYNGPGNGNFETEHYLSDALPITYDVFIRFEDEEGNEYDSSVFTIPKEATCSVVNLEYENGESKWSLFSQVEPTEETGPIELDVPEEVEAENPEVVTNLCYGCFENSNCYPLGYRKGGMYCSESKTFVSQVLAEESCDNNFECTSNVCASGECVSEGLIKKLINWFKGLF